MEIDHPIHADGTSDTFSNQENNRQGLMRLLTNEENITDQKYGD
jgi:hypothetical protein